MQVKYLSIQHKRDGILILSTDQTNDSSSIDIGSALSDSNMGYGF